MPAEFTDACGCRVSLTLTPAGADKTDFNVRVTRCKLHANAANLLARAKTVTHVADKLEVDYRVRYAINDLAAAIKACEPSTEKAGPQ